MALSEAVIAGSVVHMQAVQAAATGSRNARKTRPAESTPRAMRRRAASWALLVLCGGSGAVS